MPSTARAQAAPQVTAPPDELPPIPAGDATISGRVTHPTDPAAAAGLSVVLYGLTRDGNPGIGGTETDADGRFRFESVANTADMAYLVGTSYRGVPFGERLEFAAGQLEIDASIALFDITGESSAVEPRETVIKLDAVGARLLVYVTHQLHNSMDRVVYLAPEARAGAAPLFSSELPPGAADFVDGQQGLAGGLERDANTLHYWGPIYPGDQEIRYQFFVPLPARSPQQTEAEPAIRIPIGFPPGTTQLALLASNELPAIEAAGLETTGAVRDIEGVAYREWRSTGAPAGRAIDVDVALPESTSDTSGLAFERGDFWVDMDDTSMRVTVDLVVEADSTTAIRSGDGEPILRLDLPPNAELTGLTPDAQAMGVLPREDSDGKISGLDVYGPIPPGTTQLGYKYRAPLEAGAASLALSFPAPLRLLNVLVADIGVVIESSRMHRRRPFRSGTRLYLHRQAFQVAADEEVLLHFEPIVRTGPPRSVSIAAGLAGVTLAAGFIVLPLIRARRAPDSSEPEASPLGLEREAIYDAIRDLELDFETGKLEQADYEETRARLRADAVELLRRERSGEHDAAASSDAARDATTRCTGCGEVSDPGWKFCSHCGAAITDGGGAA